MNEYEHLIGNVIIIDNESIKNKVITISEEENLLHTLFGHDEELVSKFQSNYFQKQPVVIRGSASRLSEIKENYLFNFDVREMLDNTASDEIQVWLASFIKEESAADNIAITNANTPVDAIKVPTGEQAFKLFKAGHNAYCRAPEELESIMIPSLLKSLKYGINTNNCTNDRYARGEIETFYTNIGHKTAFHTDFQENFTIQLEGCKKWSFRKSSLTSPLRGCAPHFNATNLDDVIEQQLKVHKCTNKHFEVSEFQKRNIDMLTDTSSKKRKIDECNEDDMLSVILYPGDVLYHPAGIWHEVECIETCDPPHVPVYKNKKAKSDPSLGVSNAKQSKKHVHHKGLTNGTKMYSLAINMSLMTTTYAEVVSNAIQQLLWKNPLYRSNVRAITKHAHRNGIISRSDANSDSGGYNAYDIIGGMLQELPGLIQQLIPGDILPKPSLLDGVGEEDVDGSGGDQSDMENDSELCSNASSQMSDEGTISDCDSNGTGPLSMDGEEEPEDVGIFHSMNVMLPLPLGPEWLKDWKHTQYQYSTNGVCNMEMNSHWADKHFSRTGPSGLKINPLCSLINCNTECIPYFKGYFGKYKTVGHIETDSSNDVNNVKSVWELIENCPKHGTYYQLSLIADGQVAEYRYDVYASHCNFGNDALESISNCYIAIPMEYRRCIRNIEDCQIDDDSANMAYKPLDMLKVVKKLKHDIFIKNDDIIYEHCNYLMYCLSEVGYVTEINN